MPKGKSSVAKSVERPLLAESSHSNSPDLTYISVRYWEKQTSRGAARKFRELDQIETSAATGMQTLSYTDLDVRM